MEDLCYRTDSARIPLEVYFNHNLSDTEKNLFLTIMHYTDKGGNFTLSNEVLSELFDLSVSTFTKSFSNLQKQGFIQIEIKQGNKRFISIDRRYVLLYGPLIDNYWKNSRNEGERTARKKLRAEYDEIGHRSEKITSGAKGCIYISLFSSFPSLNNLLATQGESPSEGRAVEQESKSPENQATLKDTVNRKMKELEAKKERDRKKRMDKNPASKKAVEIMDYWKNAEGKKLVQHREGTMRYYSACKLIDTILNGKFQSEAFPKYNNYKFTVADFKTAIDRFAKAATDADYEVEAGTSFKKWLKDRPFSEFIYYPYTDNMKNKSLFIYYHENDIKLLDSRLRTVTVEDTHCFKKLSADFKDLMNMNGNELSAKQKRDISYTEEKLKAFLVKHQSNLILTEHWKNMYGCEDDVSLLGKFLIDAIKEESEGVNITSGWLCSENSMKERLPKHLKSIGLFRNYS